MTAGRRTPPSLTALLAVVFLAPLLGLFGLRVIADGEAAGRIIGINFSENDAGLEITHLRPGLPAERAGLREADLIVAIDGRPIVAAADYDAAAGGFEAGRPIALTVLRGGSPVDTTVVPGVPVGRMAEAGGLMVILIFSSLALVALHRRARDPRARLVAAFSFLGALEAALPPALRGHPVQGMLIDGFFYLITGAQMAVEFHLASVIPEKQAWVVRRRWVLPSITWSASAGARSRRWRESTKAWAGACRCLSTRRRRAPRCWSGACRCGPWACWRSSPSPPSAIPSSRPASRPG